MLRLEDVSKNFGGLPALNNVSFDVPSGQLTALIGPNGAGKSTMINCMTGILEPNSGQIYFQQKPIASLPAYKISRMGISRTFQNL